jgi:hypothetical protein
MPPALTPDLALAYVHELSADVRAVAILGADADLEAGPAGLAGPARDLIAAAGRAAELEVATGDGVVCAVRADQRAAIAVCGRFAIPGVVREDLRAALAGIAGRLPDGPPAAAHGAAPHAASADAPFSASAEAAQPPKGPVEAAAQALIAAAERVPAA